MLTAVTTYVTSDIAAVPMLWVIPLGLYLVAFIVAYARRRLVSPTVAGTALAVLAVVVVLTMLGVLGLPLWGLLALQYGMFFSAALVAATLLADDRPATEHLTGYYLLIALGGVLGGAFSGLVAPALFNSTLEYPVGLLLAVALIPPLRRAPFELRALLRDVALGLTLLLGLAVLLHLGLLGTGSRGLILAFSGSAAIAVLLRATAAQPRGRPGQHRDGHLPGRTANAVLRANLLRDPPGRR